MPSIVAISYLNLVDIPGMPTFFKGNEGRVGLKVLGGVEKGETAVRI